MKRREITGIDANPRSCIPREIVQCRSCGAKIVFLLSRYGSRIPVDAETITDMHMRFFNHHTNRAHFATCPAAAEWRQKKGASSGIK